MKTDQEYLQQLHVVHQRIKSFLGMQIQPVIAIMTGTSGPRGLIEMLEDREEKSYESLGLFSPSAVGHEGVMYSGILCGLKVVVCAGRVHYFEGYSMNEVTLMARALGMYGIEQFILTNAAGILKKGMSNMSVGSIALIHDHIDMMGDNPLRGFDALKVGLGKPFTDMTQVYSHEWINHMNRIESLPSAIYMAVCGPKFETPSEIEMFSKTSASLIGMSTVPESCAIRQFGGNVIAFSVATNYGAGISPNIISHGENLDVIKSADKKLTALIADFVKSFIKSPNEAPVFDT
jgi:purine-nucleoside phosphorylase